MNKTVIMKILTFATFVLMLITSYSFSIYYHNFSDFSWVDILVIFSIGSIPVFIMIYFTFSISLSEKLLKENQKIIELLEDRTHENE